MRCRPARTASFSGGPDVKKTDAIGRREFIRGGVAGAGCLLFSRMAPFAAASPGSADSRIEVLLGESLGMISPNIYGHFAENLGGVVYDGIWVGENSKVPNVNGIRKELVDEMRKIKAPVVRYPGGCLPTATTGAMALARSTSVRGGPTSGNRWRVRTSPASHKYDPNQFGTNEFVRFCKLIGSQPYLAANVRSLPAEAFYQWVEYCNSPAGSTTLADSRALPLDIPSRSVFSFWGVGNESWGCGGNFTAQEYAVEFRRYTAWVPRVGQELSFIASGPNDDNWDWTRGFLEEILRKGPNELRSIYGLALHYYAWNLSRGRTKDWNEGKGDAVKFDIVDWYELLRQGDVMESLINGHWLVMGEFDKNIPSSWSSTNGDPGTGRAAKPLPATFSNRCPL